MSRSTAQATTRYPTSPAPSRRASQIQRPRRLSIPRPANDNYPPPANDNHPETPKKYRSFPSIARNIRHLANGLTPSGWDIWSQNVRNINEALNPSPKYAAVNGRMMGAWTLRVECPQAGPPVMMSRDSVMACLTGQYAFADATFWDAMTEWALYDNLPRYSQVRVWTRPMPPQPTPAPELWPVPEAFPPWWLPYPSLNPALQPFQEPGLQPVVNPVPYHLIPYRKPNEEMVPGHRREDGNVPPWYIPDGQQTHPGYRWNEQYGPDIAFSPNEGKSPQIYPPTHSNNPPPRRDPEKKVRLTGLTKAVAASVFAVTEAQDVIDAVWDAMPKRYQWMTRSEYGLTYTGKMLGILRYHKQIDISDAVYNLIANHFEDAIIGRLNRGAMKSKAFNTFFGTKAALSNIGRNSGFP